MLLCYLGISLVFRLFDMHELIMLTRVFMFLCCCNLFFSLTKSCGNIYCKWLRDAAKKNCTKKKNERVKRTFQPILMQNWLFDGRWQLRFHDSLWVETGKYEIQWYIKTTQNQNAILWFHTSGTATTQFTY